MTSPGILDQLCNPMSGKQFLSEHWPDTHYWNDGNIQTLPAALRVSALQSIDNLVNNYQGYVNFGNAHTGSTTIAINHASPAALLKMGLSLYLTDMEIMIPELTAMLRQLEAELGNAPGSSRIGAFVAAESNGVTVHFDPAEVISIQLAGEKVLEIAKAKDIEAPWGRQYNPGSPILDDFYPQVATGFPDPDTLQFEKIHMKPGSVLFMPRGTWHRSETGSESMSISIFLAPPSAMEYALEAIRLQMLQDPQWRKPLFGAWGTSLQRNGAKLRWMKLKAAIPDLLDNLQLHDLLLPHMSEPQRLEHIGGKSRFQRKSEANLSITTNGTAKSTVTVTLADQTGKQIKTMELSMTSDSLGVVTWLRDQPGAFSINDMATANANTPLEQHLQLINAFVRGGYLKQLWFRSAQLN